MAINTINRPFYNSANTSGSSPALTLPNETAILAPFTQPALHAIIINNNIRLAMINNQVVAVGGTIDQFTIIGIESAHIDIDGPTGAKRLSLHTSNNEN
jgi:hypothetical protein